MNKSKESIVVLSGFLWGMAGFTLVFTNGEESLLSFVIRSVFVLLGCVILLMQSCLKIKKKYLLGLFTFVLYVASFLLSNFINEASFNNIVRELFLFFVVIVLYVLLSNEDAYKQFIVGLYYALIGLLLYGVMSIDFGLIFAPIYRLETEIGSNGIGAMASTAFVLAYARFSEDDAFKIRLIDAIVMLTAILVVYATHSRTSIATIVAAIVLLAWFYGHRKLLLAFLICIIVTLIFNFEMIDVVLRVSPLEGVSGDKNIYNLTGRTDVWGAGVEVIKDNFFLGVGSESAYIEIDGHAGTYHNAIIQLMVTVGFLGGLPIILFLIWGIKSALCCKDQHMLKVIFMTGLLGAITESRLLNYGSPANLLLLLSFLYFSASGNASKVARRLTKNTEIKF